MRKNFRSLTDGSGTVMLAGGVFGWFDDGFGGGDSGVSVISWGPVRVGFVSNFCSPYPSAVTTIRILSVFVESRMYDTPFESVLVNSGGLWSSATLTCASLIGWLAGLRTIIVYG